MMDTGIGNIGKREVDDAVFATEEDGWFSGFGCQGFESGSSPAG